MTRSDLLSRHRGLLHAFTDRSGGIGTAAYSSANLAYHVGDDPRHVDTNHTLLSGALEYDKNRLVHMRQVHSDMIVRCTADMDFGTRPECDALITDIPGQPLMVMTADCTPVLMYDPVRHAAAAVHAGRAGALKGIVSKTATALRKAYGCDPGDLRVALGPSVCPACYTVDAAIAATVETAGFGFALQPKKEDAFFLDINTILVHQLENAGVPPTHIDRLPCCTACESGRFFSYRAENGTTGRQAGIIMLK